MFRPKDWIDRLFAIGIIGKGLNGLAELIGGLLLLFVTPESIHDLVAVLTRGELSEDPNDLVARYLLHTANGLTGSAVIFGAVHLSNNGAHWVTLLSVTLAGLMWTTVFIVSRNIWVVAAHHCCWNATIFMIGVPLSGEDWRAQALFETVSHGSVLWTGGAFGPEDSLINVFVSIAICVALWRLARRTGEKQSTIAA